MREQLNRDGLTGAYNRTFLDQTLTHQLALAARHGHSVSVLMVDLDHFKQINDSDGHQAGDRALIAVAGVLEGAVRGSDLVCRYGGEEFAVICPHTKLEQAQPGLTQTQTPDRGPSRGSQARAHHSAGA